MSVETKDVFKILHELVSKPELYGETAWNFFSDKQEQQKVVQEVLGYLPDERNFKELIDKTSWLFDIDDNPNYGWRKNYEGERLWYKPLSVSQAEKEFKQLKKLEVKKEPKLGGLFD